MKRIVLLFLAVSALSNFTIAQQSGHGEAGIAIGVSSFLGDLAKKETAGNTYFHDVAAAMHRPAGSIFYRHTFLNRVSVKGSLMFTQFRGDDRLAESMELRDSDWYRNYRNLHFKSFAMEFAITGEFNILKYAPGSMNRRWTPYVFAGIGLTYYNPKAEYNGEWVALQPLGTEGQGLPDYLGTEKYSLITPVIPLGLGFKYNINQYFTVGVEVGHRIAFTDYIDDVSGTYVNHTYFRSNLDPEAAEMVIALSNRSVEIDPERAYGSITEHGMPRGNAGGNDSYFVGQVSVSYRLTKANPDFHLSCPKLKKKFRRRMR